MPKRRKVKVNDDPYLVNGHNKVIIVAKNDEQKQMMRTISENIITFIKGVPGTGKTCVAVGYALQEFMKGTYSRIIFSRPVVEAGGEKLGFLPGDISEKIDPYMLPIFEAMYQILPHNSWKKLIGKKIDSSIRILPLAYMRGTTFLNTFVVLDEMQNATIEQMRMVLTRLGDNSKMVICGDVDQSDIHKKNGLQDAFSLLEEIDGIGFCTLTADAIVRHPIIRQITERYEGRNGSNLV